jgi:tetratricopeptide (TPR) repeat protein
MFHLENYEEALKAYDKAIARNALFYEALHNRGEAKKAIEKINSSFEKLVKEGDTLCESKKYLEALTSYDKAIEIKPTDYFVWFKKGNTLEQLGKSKKAIKAYDKAILLSPNYYEAWFKKGLVAERLNLCYEAIFCFKKAFELLASQE